MSWARAILLDHLESIRGQAQPEGNDPTARIPATELSRRLREAGSVQMRLAARAYVETWKRCFPRLVRHLRGRPNRALQLFTNEVYPYLRSDSLSSRVEEVGYQQATVRLEASLPTEFLVALLTNFVELSGASVKTATDHVEGSIVVSVFYKLHPQDRIIGLVTQLNSFRISYVVHAVLGAIIGIGLTNQSGDMVRALIILIGALAVQIGANATHGYFQVRRGDQRLPLPNLTILGAAAAAGFAVALASAGFLLIETPLLAIWLVIGAILSLGYPKLQNLGLGPVTAALNYGPLMATGAYYAMVGSISYNVALASIPLGLLAAAQHFIGDLADRPLDYAGGRRTLAVRLPSALLRVTLFLALVAVPLSMLLIPTSTNLKLIACAVVFVLLGPIDILAAKWMDDHRRLAAARVAGLLLHPILAMIVLLVADGSLIRLEWLP